MSAAELIRQVAALPPQEKAAFEELYRGLLSRGENRGDKAPVAWPDFAERLRGIYGDKVAPDSQTIISDGRGAR